MSICYDLIDLVNNMIELEIAGAAFYEAQARRQRHPLLAPLFTQLAEQEQRHRVVYERLRDKLAGEAEVDSEYRDYLREIIDEKFRFDPVQAAGCTAPIDVLELGMQLERDSIRFIDAFGKLTGTRHRDIVEQIRQQEQNHLQWLLDMKAKITPGGSPS